MFVHQHHLQYLLRSEDYHSEEQYRLEVDKLFLPTWHLVATKPELSHSGDFKTLELFGHPVQIRNFEGEFYAYQNVCAHRHCLLTHQACGNSPTIRCQYHGWEYDKTGKTGRIPDAKCFRPWDRENSQLVTHRLESCGDLLFLALDDQAPPLREFLDPFYDDMVGMFSAPAWRLKHTWEYDCPCNWKVPAENTLESYHIPCLHQKTFGNIYPSEPASEHVLDPRYTLLAYDSSEDPKAALWQGRMCRWLGAPVTNQYVHRHIHPHTIVCTTDLFNYVLNYIPVSPKVTRIRVRMFAYRGLKRGPIAKTLSYFTGNFAKKLMQRIQLEDWHIFAAQQRGLETSRQRGVIGTREERIYVFQKYLLDTLGRELPDVPASGQMTREP